MVREIRPEIHVVTFRDSMPKHQWKTIEEIIKAWDLHVLSFPPAHAYFVPNGEEVSYVTEYNLNGLPVPLVRDIVPGEGCALEFDKKRLPVMSFDYDVIFVGTRNEDNHSVMGKPIQKDVTSIGPFTFIAPIFDLPKREVIHRVNHLSLPENFYIEVDEFHDTGNIPACSNCLKEVDRPVFCPKQDAFISAIEWDRKGMLSAFRDKFKFEVNNVN